MRQRAVEGTEGRREDRGPQRGQRAIKGIRAEEETESSREDSAIGDRCRRGNIAP